MSTDETDGEVQAEATRKADIASVLRLHPRFNWSTWVDFLTEYDVRGRECDAARAELADTKADLARSETKLKRVAAYCEEISDELQRLRARVAELEPIKQRARDMRDTSLDLGDWHLAAQHILGES